MKTCNIKEGITEKDTWKYLFQGFLLFSIGVMFLFYKLGKWSYKFIIWFGKFTWKTIETIGKKYEKQNYKKQRKTKNKK